MYSLGMIFRVIPMRRRGRRLPESKLRGQSAVIGDLLTEIAGGTREAIVVARLRSLAGPRAADLLPALYAPTIVRIAPLALCLRGFEAHGEGAERTTVIQEWLCSPAE